MGSYSLGLRSRFRLRVPLKVTLKRAPLRVRGLGAPLKGIIRVPLKGSIRVLLGFRG